MKKVLTASLSCFLLVALFAPLPAMAQQAVETAEGTVLRVVGRTVFIRNDTTNEIKKYNELPDGVSMYVDGRPAKIEDLREGMKLKAYRFENVAQPPVTVTMSEMEAEAPTSSTARSASGSSSSASSSGSTSARQLPKTASPVPLFGLAGLLLIALGGAIGLRRAG